MLSVTLLTPIWAAILRRALAQQKVVEGADLEQPIGAEGRVHVHFVTLQLQPEAHVMPVARVRDRVLPDKAVGVLPLRRRAGISGSE